MFYQTLKPNTRGRDFVVGDLHGCYAQLCKALRAVKFDGSRDRLFSVGDLIDRGPDSYACLQLLEEPWFYPVLGNHEAMLLTWVGQRGSDRHCARDFIHNGGHWVTELTDVQEDCIGSKLLGLLKRVPLVIHVEDDVLPFNVLHAEAMSPLHGVLLTDQALRTQNLESQASRLIWDRRLLWEAMLAVQGRIRTVAGVRISAEPVEPGLSLTYVGHSTLDRPILHRSHAYIDCGVHRRVPKSGYLHMVEHQSFAKKLKKAGVHGFPQSLICQSGPSPFATDM